MPRFLLIILFEGCVCFFLRQFFGGFDSHLEIISTVIIFINSVLFVFIIPHLTQNRSEYPVYLLAYFIRLFLLYWDIYGRSIFVLPNSSQDSEMFNMMAVLFVQGEEIQPGGGFYSLWLGVVYKLFGTQRLLAQYLNIVISLCAIVIYMKICDKLILSARVKYYTLLLVSFLPNYMVTSSILLRESVIILLITLSLYYFLVWWETGNFLSFLFSLFSGIIAALFHSGAIAVVIAYALIFALYNRPRDKFNFNVKAVVTGILFSMLFLGVHTLYGDVLFRKFSRAETITDAVQVAEAYTSGNSAYLTETQANDPVDILRMTPIRMFYFIASPLPWHFRGLSDVVAFLFSGCFYLFSFLIAVLALIRAEKKRKNLLMMLLTMAFISTLLFAWGVSNSGTALRHREKFLMVHVAITAVSMDIIMKNDKKQAGISMTPRRMLYL